MVSFTEWNREIFKILSKNQEEYRTAGINENNAEIILSNYFHLFGFVLNDLYKAVVLELENGDEIMRYVKENFSIKDTSGQIAKARIFLDLTTGQKINVFNKFDLLDKIKDHSGIRIERVKDSFGKIARDYLPLRNWGVEHRESTPSGLVRPKVELTSSKVEESAGVFDVFLKELGIISVPNMRKLIENIPSQDCFKFIGRKKKGAEILEYIKKDTVKAIGIIGFGGFGKTELMKQVAYELRDGEVTYDALLWISFKRDKYVVDEDKIDPTRDNENFKDLEDVFDFILERVGAERRDELNLYPYELKNLKVRNILTEQRVVLFLDNYESIRDTSARMKNFVERPESYPSNLKIVLSCRQEVDPFRIKNVSLGSFSKKETTDFLRSLFDLTGKEFNLSDNFIAKITDKSFGHPFSLRAIGRWVIEGKINEYNIDTILISSLNSTKIGDFCFKKDYNSLSETTRHLLCLACAKPEITKDELRQMARMILNLHEAEFNMKLNNLSAKSFLLNPNDPDKIMVPDMIRYYVRSEIPQEKIRISQNEFAPLTYKIGESWKKLKESSPELVEWEEVSREITFLLNKPQKEEYEIYYDLLEKLNRLEKTKRSDGRFYYYRAYIQYWCGNKEEALTDIQQTLEIEPLQEDFVIFRAKLSHESGDTKNAKQILSLAIDKLKRPSIKIFASFCELISSYSEFEPYFNYYFSHGRNVPNFRIDLLLINKLLYTIYVALRKEDETSANKYLNQIYENLCCIEAFLIKKKEDIYHETMRRYLEYVIKSLREIGRKFRTQGNSNKFSEIKDRADKLQTTYKEIFDLFSDIRPSGN